MRQRLSWAVTRQKGRWHFVLVRGVLGWGSAMFVGMSLMPVLMHRHEPTWSYLVRQVCVWAIGGACFGYATWSWSEWLFNSQAFPEEVQPLCGPISQTKHVLQQRVCARAKVRHSRVQTGRSRHSTVLWIPSLSARKFTTRTHRQNLTVSLRASAN